MAATEIEDCLRDFATWFAGSMDEVAFCEAVGRIEGLVSAAVAAEKERAEVAEAELAKRKRLGIDPWHWMGDGSDHLESLACPILIEPDDLRAAIRTSLEPKP